MQQSNTSFEKTKKQKPDEYSKRDPKRDKSKTKDFKKQREQKRGLYE